MFRFLLFAVSIFILVAVSNAQTTTNTGLKKGVSNQAVFSIKSSPAYTELLLQKTELEAQLEDFLGDYTEDFPKIKELRFQIDLLQKEANRFLSVGASDVPKLSAALGKLTIRRIELQTSLWNLQKQYKDDYPDVRRLKRKIEVFERAIREILP